MSLKKNLLIFLTIVLSSSQNVSAAEFLPEGSKTQYAGYLFTEQEAKSLRSELIEKDTLFKLNESYKSENILLTQSLDYRLQQVKLLQDDVNNQETRKYLYVAAGVVVTLLSVYAATKVIQATK